MKKNGFTLIELLAVIIILAIIALITTPIILNVVNKARLDAAKDKAWGTIDAVRMAFAEAQADPEWAPSFPISVNFEGNGGSIGEDHKVRMSGQRPKAGTVSINEDGTLTCTNLQYDSYCCTTEDGNTMDCKTTSTGQCKDAK